MRCCALAVPLLLAACGGEEPARLPQNESAQPAPEGGRTFGARIDESRELTPLSTIVAEPERFRDRVIRTEGEIAQVCQRMGCWIELREQAEAPRVRVPMAGHSFFLPRDVAGRRATIEGRVSLESLPADVREHLESEGATATSTALAIHATGVIVR